MTRRPRPAAQQLSPRMAVTEPALSVTFMTAAYPALGLDEAEADMIARVAVDRLDVPAEAVMAAPAPRYLGQGDNDESLFEIHLRQRFAKAGSLRSKAAVLHVAPAGPAVSRAKLPPADKRLRLPRKK